MRRVSEASSFEAGVSRRVQGRKGCAAHRGNQQRRASEQSLIGNERPEEASLFEQSMPDSAISGDLAWRSGRHSPCQGQHAPRPRLLAIGEWWQRE